MCGNERQENVKSKQKRKTFRRARENFVLASSGDDVDGKQVVWSCLVDDISVARSQSSLKVIHNFQLISRLINANDIPRGSSLLPLHLHPSSRRLHN